MNGLLLFLNRKWNNLIRSMKIKRRNSKGFNQRRQIKNFRTQPMRKMILLFSDKMIHFMINLKIHMKFPLF